MRPNFLEDEKSQPEKGWDQVVRSKSLFELGFEGERADGSLGRPEGQAIS